MPQETSRPWWRLSSWVVLIGFLAVGAFFLIAEHRAHTLGVLPFLLVLACPLMHLFHGHGGRDGHGGGGKHEDHTAEKSSDKAHQH